MGSSKSCATWKLRGYSDWDVCEHCLEDIPLVQPVIAYRRMGILHSDSWLPEAPTIQRNDEVADHQQAPPTSGATPTVTPQSDERDPPSTESHSDRRTPSSSTPPTTSARQPPGADIRRHFLRCFRRHRRRLNLIEDEDGDAKRRRPRRPAAKNLRAARIALTSFSPFSPFGEQVCTYVSFKRVISDM